MTHPAPHPAHHTTAGPQGRLLAMHSGDGAAAQALWDDCAGRLVALARAITGSAADAQDAVQEVFIGVLSMTAEQVRAIDDEAGYLAGAVRRRSLNLLRGGARRGRRQAEASAPALRLVGAAGEDAALRDAVESLPLELREVVALKHYAGLTFEQMALALALPRATAASRYYSAVEALRSALASPAADSTEVARAL